MIATRVYKATGDLDRCLAI